MNVNVEFVGGRSSDSAQAEETRCAWCHRDLKSPAEWICGRDYVICESCYSSLLYPERSDYSQANN